jgi:hypothetical protein
MKEYWVGLENKNEMPTKPISNAGGKKNLKQIPNGMD